MGIGKQFRRGTVLTALLLTLACGASAGPAGLGLIIGDTTGLSFKYYLGKHEAFDLALGAPWGYFVNPGISMHADYMYVDVISPVERGRWLYHLGAGVGAAIGRDAGSGEFDVRFTVGTEYFFHRSKFALFGELVPSLALNVPAFIMHGAFGCRYYF